MSSPLCVLHYRYIMCQPVQLMLVRTNAVLSSWKKGNVWVDMFYENCITTMWQCSLLMQQSKTYKYSFNNINCTKCFKLTLMSLEGDELIHESFPHFSFLDFPYFLTVLANLLLCCWKKLVQRNFLHKESDIQAEMNIEHTNNWFCVSVNYTL